MKLSVRLVPAIIWLASALAANAQTGPVPMRGVSYGPDRVDAGFIFNYGGQVVSACGRVGRVDAQQGVLVIADNLRVFMPPGVDLQGYFGVIACARGRVMIREGQYEGRYSAIEIQNPPDLEVIAGTGPYSPPVPQCGAGQMFDPSAGGCVRRWRASPYGGG